MCGRRRHPAHAAPFAAAPYAMPLGPQRRHGCHRRQRRPPLLVQLAAPAVASIGHRLSGRGGNAGRGAEQAPPGAGPDGRQTSGVTDAGPYPDPYARARQPAGVEPPPSYGYATASGAVLDVRDEKGMARDADEDARSVRSKDEGGFLGE